MIDVIRNGSACQHELFDDILVNSGNQYGKGTRQFPQFQGISLGQDVDMDPQSPYKVPDH